MSARVRPLCLALGLAAFAPCAATAEEPAARPRGEELRRQVERWQRQEAEEAQLRKEWQLRERERIQAIETARAQVAEVEASRVRARDGAHAGVKRSEWTRRAREARQALDDAERDLAALHEAARQADVPPGWLGSDD